MRFKTKIFTSDKSKQMKKNIVLLLLDSMCMEDIKFIKGNLKHFPAFKSFLSKKSPEYSNAYGASTPTEHVMPTLFTGELPLNGKTYGME